MQNNRFKKRSGSVDGMLTGGLSSRQHLRPKSKFSQPNKGSLGQISRGKLDNFKVSDGFHSAQQPVITTPSYQTSPEPRLLGKDPLHGEEERIDLSLPPSTEKPKRNLFQRIRRWPKRKYFAIPAVIVLIFGFLVVKGIWRLNQVFRGGGGAAALQDNVDPTKLRGEGDGRVNVLLLGKGGVGHTAPDLTDTILVASLDPVNKKAGLLSVPRDLYYSNTSNKKVNSIYAEAKQKAKYEGKNDKEAEEVGLKAIDKIVEEYMGIPIHYHAMVDFDGFRKAIDTVGGVDINVKPENTVYEVLWDDSTHSHFTLDVKAGEQHFNGQRALFYARSRYTSSRGDFDRAERQRMILFGLKSKVVSAGTLANPAKISSLMDAFGQHVIVNMTKDEVVRLYELSKDITSDNVISIGLADPPNNFLITDNINGLSIVRPKAGLTNYSDVQNYVRNVLRDGFIAKEDAKILILNGTAKNGLATTKSDELKSYGYNVLEVGTVPTQDYKRTILVDLRNGTNKYTKHYLQKRLGITAVEKLPDNKINPGNADFVIILGQ